MITGGAKKLTPDNVTVTLVKKIDETEVTGEAKGKVKEDISPGSLESIEQTLEKLEKMKEDGKINEQECKRMRGNIIERY